MFFDNMGGQLWFCLQLSPLLSFDDKKTRTMQFKINAEEFFSGRNIICLLITKLCGYDKDNNTLKSSVLEKEDDV